MIFKYVKDIKRFSLLHPKLVYIFSSINDWLYREEGSELLITSTIRTIEENNALNSKSTTHLTGRAIDCSLDNIKDFEKFNAALNHYAFLYQGEGAISNSDNKEKLFKVHVGTARHLHIQVHSRYALEISKKQVKEIDSL